MNRRDVQPGAGPQDGPEIGRTYKMRHCRKGVATVRILGINGEWIDVEVVRGTLQGIGAGSRREPGDRDTVRACHASFVPCDVQSAD